MRPTSTNPNIYIASLPDGVTKKDLSEKFGSIGVIKKDKRTQVFDCRRLRVWFVVDWSLAVLLQEQKIHLYLDKQTGEPKGDASITFEDPSSASAAVDWFNNTDFKGAVRSFGALPFDQKHDHVAIRSSRWSLLQRGSGKDLPLVVVMAVVVEAVEAVEEALEVVATVAVQGLVLEDSLKKTPLGPLLEEETGSARRKVLL